MKLWYKSPAKNFNEALPLGNGRLGAMHYGDPFVDKLSLNDDTLWSGYPIDLNRVGAYKFLPQIRKLIDNKNFKAAEDIVERELLSNYHENYLPLGDLNIYLGIKEYKNYKRELSLDKAMTVTEFESGSDRYVIKSYVSYPDDCLIYSVECSNNKVIELKLELKNQLMSKAEYSDVNKCYCLSGYAPEFSPPHYYITDFPTVEGNRGMGFAAVIKAVEGELVTSEGFDEFHFNPAVVIKGKGKISFALTSRTGFKGYNEMPSRDIDKLRSLCIAKLDKARLKGEKNIFECHLNDYKSLFDRTSLNLHSTKSFTPTDERIINNYKSQNDMGLIELLFNYGKYLTISASRTGSQCMTLQGIWNDNVKPPWSSNYTVNINTEMNYWPTEIINLPECTMPLFSLISNLSENGKATARKMYGMNGSCAHHNSDIWAKTSPVSRNVNGGARWAMWPMSLAWFCSHLFEHYLFTEDTEFLKDTAYEVIYQSALFLLDWFYEENGTLKTCPSISPENAYIFNEKTEILTYSSTMDIAMAREVFNILLKTEKILSVKDGLSVKAAAALKKLPPYKIGNEGQLLEYSEDFKENEIHHRHKSHLIGVYPFNDILTSNDIDLLEAVKTSMNRRGDESTGWSLAWKICIWARLLDGNRAEKLIQNQLRPVFAKGMENCGGVYINMLDAHPPFQIDGNFGATAGICEMLLQSYNNIINVLPAIPESWKQGEVKGLKARGNITVDILWNENSVEVLLSSSENKKVTVKYKNNIQDYSISKNIKTTINYKNN